MTLDLGAPTRGCLLLADISGYTEYMGSTELMHAQDVVADLLETIVDAIEPTFLLSKLEGDAAFAYASSDTITPSLMLDTVEAAYVAFRQRLRDIAHATSCPCDACIRIPDLDLKFFVHDGEYVVHRIARSEELTGPDVILVHRLAKGTAADMIGTRAYAVYTKATLDTMAIDPSILGFAPHQERLADVGTVDVFVQDLARWWTFEQERTTDLVESADAVYEYSFDTPAPPALVWQYLTDPVKRPTWQTDVTEVVALGEGRQGIGSVNHCMHGPDAIVEHISDWRPFSYLTIRYEVAGLVDWAWTYLLDATGDTTRVTMRLSDPGEDRWPTYEAGFTAAVAHNATSLREVLTQALADEHVG